VVAFSDIIDFLVRLLTDDAARAQFEQDPEGTLEQAGLEGVTAQDIRDARLQLADSGAVHATDDGAGSAYPDGDDPVREIGYTTQHYVADENVDVDDAGHADLNLVDGGSTLVTIDDRDTIFFQSISDDDVTITDSFNQDNSDDDFSAVQDNSVDVVSIDADGSFNNVDNSDDDLTAVQDNSVDIGSIEVGGDGSASSGSPLPVDVGGGSGGPTETPADADVPEIDEGAEPPADADTEPVDEPVDTADDTPDETADDVDDALAV
jgi:hypothetical protein